MRKDERMKEKKQRQDRRKIFGRDWAIEDHMGKTTKMIAITIIIMRKITKIERRGEERREVEKWMVSRGRSRG